jgi:hypothetical protein
VSAQQTLERLFQRAEAAASRGATGRVSLTMSEASCPEYTAQQTLDEFEAYHAYMALAERAGCVRLEWTRMGGTGRGLKRIALADHAALANFLGRPLRSSVVERARELLAPYGASLPIVQEVLERWRLGKPVRGLGPEHALDVKDALDVALDAAGRTDAERLLRSESVRRFGDSKRLERLVPWLDVVGSGQLQPTGLPVEDILAQFGLRRVPQPALLSGTGRIELSGAWVPMLRPYLGLPPEAVARVEGAPRFVLSIENLTSFHETLLAYPEHEGWLLYSGGMPSPSWRRFYARLLEGCSSGCPVYHWGDIDEGGFRIAAVLHRAATEAGHQLRPWMMSPAHARSAHPEASFRPSRAAEAIARCCEVMGWGDVADDVRREPWEIEQEALRPVIPH